MSSLHIPAWSPEEIANWIKGLDNDLEKYIPTFLAHQVTGDRLLNMSKQELEDMKIIKMGHQELILEAVDLLSLVHYGHPTETLQSVALNLNCKASNLANLLDQRLKSGSQPGDMLYCSPSTILLRVAETISAAKTLISWLDRPPFSNGPERDFQECSKDILHYALEMTQAVQLHTDLTGALPEIMAIAREFASIADNLIKQSTDPLVIQPTTIEEVRIKKKQPEEELGLFIKTSTIDGIHYIIGTKDKSAASLSRKVGSGDELLRVNEQTVVSWEHCKVIAALKADPMGVCLTLRKRPCNLGSPGQILRPGNATYNMRLGGTPKLMRKDSFPSMRSPIMKEEFLMPMSPNDLLISKQRSNSDPETQSETHVAHVAHSDSEALVQEAERIKKQRRGTMGEGLQRKGSRGQTTEGRPRSLPINTEELEAEVAMWKASPISSRPDFSPIAGSPVSPATAGSTQISPLPNGDQTPVRTANPIEGGSVSGTAPAAKTPADDPSSAIVGSSGALTFVLSKPQLEISKPVEDDCCQGNNIDQPPAEEEVRLTPVPDRPGVTESPSSPPGEVIPEAVEAKNTNNNVGASADDVMPQEVTGDLSGVVTSDLDDFVVIEGGSAVPASPATPTKSVTFIERTQSLASVLASDITTTVKLRPKKTRKYKFTRGVSCVDLGPGECQGWLYKKSDTKQTFRSNWTEMWFVLKDFVLYYYKSKSDTKAKGVICLPGYLISDAPESKKEHTFKAVHQGTKPIYFAAHRQNDKNNWIAKLGLAAIMYTDKKKMRMSVLFESQSSLDVGAMMDSGDGYHSESEDDDKDRKSVQSGSLSPSLSEKFGDRSSSESGSPPPEVKYRRSHTSPDLLSLSDESGTQTSLPKLYMKKTREAGAPGPGSGSFSPKGSPKIVQRMIDKFRRHSRGSLSMEPGELASPEGNFTQRRNSSPFDEELRKAVISPTPTVSITSPASPKASDDRRPSEGAAIREDALLDHYMTLMEEDVGVSGLERTPEARTSKRFNRKGAGLTRIQTILDKNPQKNKKALQRRALQRTLKAKQEELLQIDDLLSKASISSEGLQNWRVEHGEALELILSGPKPQSSSGSDSDQDQEASKNQRQVETPDQNPQPHQRRGAQAEDSQPGAGISGETRSSRKEPGTEAGGNKELQTGDGQEDEMDSVTSTGSGSSPASPTTPVLEVSRTTGPVLVLDDFRARAGSGASETSL